MLSPVPPLRFTSSLLPPFQQWAKTADPRVSIFFTPFLRSHPLLGGLAHADCFSSSLFSYVSLLPLPPLLPSSCPLPDAGLLSFGDWRTDISTFPCRPTLLPISLFFFISDPLHTPPIPFWIGVACSFEKRLPFVVIAASGTLRLHLFCEHPPLLPLAPPFPSPPRYRGTQLFSPGRSLRTELFFFSSTGRQKLPSFPPLLAGFFLALLQQIALSFPLSSCSASPQRNQPFLFLSFCWPPPFCRHEDHSSSSKSPLSSRNSPPLFFCRLHAVRRQSFFFPPPMTFPMG